MAAPQTAKSPRREKATTLLLIALFKLIKAALLLAVGIGALKLLHKDIAETLTHWIELLRVDPENRFIHQVLSRATSISPAELKAASAGTFVYAGLLLIEGVGLLLRKRWAEYFTIVTTGVLVPLEIYELVRHVSVMKLIVLLVNVAIVVYLVVRVRKVENK